MVLSHSDFCGLLEFHDIRLLKMKHCSWKTGHVFIYILHKLDDHVTDFFKFTKLFNGKLQEVNLITRWRRNVFRVLVPGSACMSGVVVEGSECDCLWISVTRGGIELVLVS